MWWRRFVDCRDAVRDLPPEKLTHLNNAALSQLKQMQERETSLRSKISEVAYDFCCLLATDDQTAFLQEFSEMSADEQRYRQLRATQERLQFELEKTNREILAQQMLQTEMGSSAHSSDLPTPLRTICTKLTELALVSTEVADRDDCLYGLSILTGDLRFVSASIRQNSQIFQRHSNELRAEVDLLIKKTARSVKKVHDLGRSLEESAHPTAIAGASLQRVKEQLEGEIADFGDTREALLHAKQRWDALKMKRDDLQNECSAISAELLAGSIDTGLSTDELQAAADLRQKRIQLGVQESELRHRHKLLESEIRTVRDAQAEARKEIEECSEQTKILLRAIEDQKTKISLIEQASVGPTDVDIVIKCAGQGTLVDLRNTVEQKKELLQLMKRRKKNTIEKGATLLEQEKQIDSQMQNLTELLESAKRAEQASSL
jgi:hypothetical protein